MTDAQYEHALAVENLASSLAALRIELCPAYMSEYCFWRIYFVLVHPIFSKHDALTLSTPQVSLILNTTADHYCLFLLFTKFSSYLDVMLYVSMNR
jgi:hypothetical protein